MKANSIELVPPQADFTTAQWTDPRGCVNTDDDADCPPCHGCGQFRSYSPPAGAGLSASINVDDKQDSNVQFQPGIFYSDCIFFAHGAPSGEGCSMGTATCDDCPEYGQSVTLTVTRTFPFAIDQLRLILRDLNIDDIGYVGATQLNDCCDYLVDFPLDVTDQVTISGNIASVTLRAADVACSQNFLRMDFNWIFRLKDE